MCAIFNLKEEIKQQHQSMLHNPEMFNDIKKVSFANGL